MEKFRFVKKLALMLVFVPLLLAARSANESAFLQAMPPLMTDEDLVRALLEVKRDIPDLISQSPEYSVNPMQLLSDQAKLVNTLRTNPAYLKAVARKSSLLQITVKPSTTGAVMVPRIKPAAIEDWKSELSAELSSFKENAPISSGVSKKIAEILSAMKTNAGNLTTGLIQTLSPEAKREAFQAPTLERKIEILSSALPEKLPESFDYAKNGFQSPPSRQDAIAEVRRLEALGSELRRLSEVQLLLQDESGVIRGTRAEAQMRIDALSEGALRALNDKDFLGTEMEKLSRVLQQNGQKAKTSELLSSVKSHANQLVENVETIQLKPEKSLLLKEVPPWVSAFRGYAGGDCSSSMSFPYPNDPQEKVFFIYGESGNLKGYAQGTVLMEGGKKSFYLTSINGARLTHADTESVIRAFDQAKSALGVEQIVVPRTDMIDTLTNYDETYDVFNELAQNRNKVPLQYIDPEIRQEIEKLESRHNLADYDRAKSHKNGVVYDGNFHSPRLTQVEVEIAHAPLTPFEHRSVTQAEKFGLVTDLLDAGRSPKVSPERLLNGLGLNMSQFTQLQTAVENNEGLPLSEYRSRVKNAIEAIFHDPELLNGNELRSSLTRGSLRAADAFSGPNKEKTFQQIRTILSTPNTKDGKNFVTTAVKSLGAAFERNEITADEIIHLVKPYLDGEHRRLLAEIVQDLFPHGRGRFEPIAEAVASNLSDSNLREILATTQLLAPDSPELEAVVREIMKRPKTDTLERLAFASQRVRVQPELLKYILDHFPPGDTKRLFMTYAVTPDFVKSEKAYVKKQVETMDPKDAAAFRHAWEKMPYSEVEEEILLLAKRANADAAHDLVPLLTSAAKEGRASELLRVLVPRVSSQDLYPIASNSELGKSHIDNDVLNLIADRPDDIAAAHFFRAFLPNPELAKKREAFAVRMIQNASQEGKQSVIDYASRWLFKNQPYLADCKDLVRAIQKSPLLTAEDAEALKVSHPGLAACLIEGLQEAKLK